MKVQLLQLIFLLLFLQPRCVTKTLLMTLRPGPEIGKQ